MEGVEGAESTGTAVAVGVEGPGDSGVVEPVPAALSATGAAAAGSEEVRGCLANMQALLALLEGMDATSADKSRDLEEGIRLHQKAHKAHIARLRKLVSAIQAPQEADAPDVAALEAERSALQEEVRRKVGYLKGSLTQLYDVSYDINVLTALQPEPAVLREPF